MGSPKDFLAKQIRTTQVMASGSFGNEYPDLLIYRTWPHYDGALPPHIEAGITGTAGELSIGKDVWFYVDAASGPNHPIGQTGDSGTVRENNSVVLFAGDVVVSGTLWAERQVLEVTTIASDKFEGDMILSGNLFAKDQYSGSGATFIAPGANQWVDFQSLGGTSLFVIDSVNERVGIHTPDPLFDLHIVDDREGNARFAITQYADDSPGDGPDIMLQRSRGDLSAGASGVVDGDRLGSIYFQGAAGPAGILGNDQIAAAVSAVVQGNPTIDDGGVPAAIGWRTGDGTETTLKWRLASSADGRIGIGGHNATKDGDAQLHIIWSSATGAGVTSAFDPGATSMLVGDGPLKIEGLELDTTATKNLVISDDGVVKYGYATIGPPCETTLCDGDPDNTYADGLFMDWTELTPLGCAIDRMNEVLGSMAPQPAPLCNSLDEVTTTVGNLVSSDFRPATLSELTHPEWLGGGQTAHGTVNAISEFVGPVGMFPGPIIQNGYYSANAASATYPDPEDPRGATSPTEHERDHRLGVFYGHATNLDERPTFKCIMNWNDDQDPASGAAIGANYPTGAFGRGDQGTLSLWVNGTIQAELVLDGATEGATSSLGANGDLISVGTLEPAHFDNGEELCTYFHRESGEVHIGGTSMRLGWNWARIQHHGTDMVDEGNGIFTNFITWILDDHANEPQINPQSTPAVTESSYTWLSGVKYIKTGNVAYSYTIDGAYENFYWPTNALAGSYAVQWHDESPNGAALTLPTPKDLPAAGSYTDTVLSTAIQDNAGTANLLVPTCNLVNGRWGDEIDLRITVQHPFDNADIGPDAAWATTASWNKCFKEEIDSGWNDTFLIYDSEWDHGTGYAAEPTCESTTVELFRTEYWRLQDNDSNGSGTHMNDYDTQNDVTSAVGTGIPANAWNSQIALSPVTTGHKGLLCCKGRLSSPSNTDHVAVTDGRFGDVNHPAGNIDYDGENHTNHVRWFYRAFQNPPSGGFEASFLINIETNDGDSTDIVPRNDEGSNYPAVNAVTTGADVDKMLVEIKLPDGGNDTTGWMDCATQFQPGQFNDGDGCLGPAYTSPASCTDSHRICNTSPGEIRIFLDTRKVAPGEWIVVRLCTSEGWVGSINKLEVDWGGY